jgi:glycosyltransferase involved in cell wall biosynthesis
MTRNRTRSSTPASSPVPTPLYSRLNGDGVDGDGVDGDGVERPAVSIIVPAHNAADYLEPTIANLLSQTFPSTEIVLVDDGSTDATAVIARRLADQHPRLTFHWLPFNVGVARAREHAARQARGAYLWFVDVDDHPATDAVARLVEAARRTGADVVICGAEFRYPDGRTRPIPAPRLPVPVSGEHAFRMLLGGEITGHLWNKLFRSELAERIDFTPARVHSDLAMVAQLIAAARQVAAIPDLLYSYTQRSGSILRSGSKRMESLALVDQAVERAARGLDPQLVHSRAYRYFQLRFIALSGLKDALTGPYDRTERKALVARLRPRITFNTLVDLLAARDWKRLVLALTAKSSLPLHRLLLRLAGTRNG